MLPKEQPSQNPFNDENRTIRNATPFEDLREIFTDPEGTLDSRSIASEVDRLIRDAEIISAVEPQAALGYLEFLHSVGEYYQAVKKDWTGLPADEQETVQDSMRAFIRAGNKYAQWAYPEAKDDQQIWERMYGMLDKNVRWASHFQLERERRENLNNRIVIGRTLALMSIETNRNTSIALLTEQRDALESLLSTTLGIWKRFEQKDVGSDAYNETRGHVADYFNNLGVMYSDLSWTTLGQQGTQFDDFIGLAVRRFNESKEFLASTQGSSREDDAEKIVRAESNGAYAWLLRAQHQYQTGGSLAENGHIDAFTDGYGAGLTRTVELLHSYPTLQEQFSPEVLRRTADGLILLAEFKIKGLPKLSGDASITVFDASNFVPSTLHTADKDAPEILARALEFIALATAASEEPDDKTLLKFTKKRFAEVQTLLS